MKSKTVFILVFEVSQALITVTILIFVFFMSYLPYNNVDYESKNGIIYKKNVNLGMCSVDENTEILTLLSPTLTPH